MRAWTRLSASASSRPVVRRFRPTVETLEDRAVPTIGTEFAVDLAISKVRDVSSASSANGTSVVVWSEDVGGGDFNVFAQRFDPTNSFFGGQIPVASLAGDEDNVDVAMDAAGNFVVVWQQDIGNGNLGIRYATFNSTGGSVAFGLVADSPATDETNPHVTMNGAGIWTVVFQVGGLNGGDIFARRYDLNGVKRGGDVLVSISPLDNELDPVIDGNTAGRFAIAYVHRTGTADRLFVKRFSPTGKLLGKSKLATDSFAVFTDDLESHDVAMDNAGNTTVVYAQDTPLTDYDIFSRKVTRQGVLGGRRTLSNLAGFQLGPVIGMDRVTGRFVVAFPNADTTIVQERAKNGSLLVEHPAIADPPDTMSPQSVSVDGDGTYLIGLYFFIDAGDQDPYAVFGELP